VDSIRCFYRELNKSVSGEENRNRWKHFREAVTGFAMEGFIAGGSTVVIGAGNMNDIDFKTISGASGAMILADIDTMTISENISDKVTVAEIDFGCLDDIAAATAQNEMIQTLKAKTPRVKSSIAGKKFNNILVSPYYTQIVLPWVFSLFPGMKPESEIVEAALGLAGKIILQSNEYIRSLAEKNCRLCLWTDMLEYDIGNPAYTDIVSNISDNVWMDSFLEQYTNEFGYGLGSYGHSEMEEYLKATVHKWLIWPFDSKRSLVVKITSGTL
jgi:hypothetical protein